MNFLRKLFKPFAKAETPKAETPKPEAPKPEPKAHEDWWAKWQREQQEKASAMEVELKPWLSEMLRQHGELKFSWESGNDEAFVTLHDFKESEEAQYELEEYLILKLEIPDAGEFEMKGKGTLYVYGGAVWAAYRFTMREMVDYDEETEQEVFGEAEEEKHKKELFVI